MINLDLQPGHNPRVGTCDAGALAEENEATFFYEACSPSLQKSKRKIAQSNA